MRIATRAPVRTVATSTGSSPGSRPRRSSSTVRSRRLSAGRRSARSSGELVEQAKVASRARETAGGDLPQAAGSCGRPLGTSSTPRSAVASRTIRALRGGRNRTDWDLRFRLASGGAALPSCSAGRWPWTGSRHASARKASSARTVRRAEVQTNEGAQRASALLPACWRRSVSGAIARAEQRPACT